MARIAGNDLPRNKRGIIGLTYVYGIGPTVAKEILDRVGVDQHTKIGDWTDDNIREISKLIHRGLRHRKGLPLRGQRTQTNARTRKGKKKTVAGKKKVTK